MLGDQFGMRLGPSLALLVAVHVDKAGRGWCGLVEVLSPEDEVVAEVLVADGGVLGQFLAGALEEDLALEQQVGPVGDAQRLGSIVVGDKDADVFALEAIDDALNVLHGDGIYSGEGLVQHDKARVDSQAAGNLGATALAT